MTVAVVGTSVGPNTNGTSTSTSLPSGTTTGDVTILAVVFQSAVTLVPPSGWAAIVNVPGFLVCYRVYQAGDPTSVTTTATTGTGFWESLGIAYSGLDTTNPVDAANVCPLYSSISAAYYAPSVSPGFATDTLLCIYGRGGSAAGSALTLPSGLTSQVSTVAGPCLQIASKTLTSAAPTGPQKATGTISNQAQVGAQIALKAAGATAVSPTPQTTLAGIQFFYSNSASWGPNLTNLGVLPGDLVVVFASGPDLSTLTPPAGYTLAASIPNVVDMFTHSFVSGDAVAPLFTTSLSFFEAQMLLVRGQGSGAALPSLDISGTASGSSGTVTSPNLTSAGSNELLCCFFGVPSTAGGTWTTLPTGFSDDPNSGSGPSTVLGWLEPAANPTGAFTAAQSQGIAIGVIAALFGLGAVPVVSSRQYFLPCGLI